MEQQDPQDLVIIQPENDFPHRYFRFITKFEEKHNILSSFQLMDFMSILNNLYYNSNYTSLVSESGKFEKSFVYHNNILTRDIFLQDFVKNKILRSPLLFTADRDAALIKDTFISLITRSFDYMHNLSKKNNPNFELGLPKYSISIFGLHYCEWKITQKINVILNIISGADGNITINKPNPGEHNSSRVTKNFLFQYIVAAILPTLNLLIDKANKNTDQEMIEFLGDEEFARLKADFYDDRHPPENDFNPVILIDLGANKPKDVHLRTELNSFVNAYVFNTVFGNETNKKTLSRDAFRNFLLDSKEGGGFWMLYKEGIRSKFEFFLEHQNK